MDERTNCTTPVVSDQAGPGLPTTTPSGSEPHATVAVGEAPCSAAAPGVSEAALAALGAGLSVIPIKADGTKAPGIPWKPYQTAPPTIDEVARWFGSDQVGLAVVCGTGSGGLEALDFDDQEAYEEFVGLAEASGLRDCVAQITQGYNETTPGGGRHLFYRCTTVAGSQQLARNASSTTPTIRIETRGQGGYCIVAPSNGAVHPSGRPYELQAGSFATIATIAPDEREELLRLCRALDQTPPQVSPEQVITHGEEGQGRPGDVFNRRATWDEVLPPHGWKALHQHGRTTYWQRPGKNLGVSATTNFSGHDTLKVFSTSTAFSTEGTHTKFGAYALLHHDGDFRAAAAALAARGYGTRPSPTTTTAERFPLLTTVDLLHRPPPRYLVEGVLGVGALSVWFGESGCCKTFVVLDLALCIATGRKWHGHEVVQGPVVYIVGEGQASFPDRVRAWLTHHGVEEASANAFFLTEAPQLATPQDLEALQARLDTLPEPPVLIVIDTYSASNVGKDENDNQDTSRWTAATRHLCQRYGCAVVAIHHPGWAEKGRERGSYGLRATQDTTVKVERTGTGITISCVKQRDAAQFDRIQLRLLEVDIERGDGAAGSSLVVVDNAEGVAAPGSDLQRTYVKSLEALAHLPEGRAGSRAWQDATGLPEKTFHNHRGKLIEARVVEESGTPHVYRVTPEGYGALGLPLPTDCQMTAMAAVATPVALPATATTL